MSMFVGLVPGEELIDRGQRDNDAAADLNGTKFTALDALIGLAPGDAKKFGSLLDGAGEPVLHWGRHGRSSMRLDVPPELCAPSGPDATGVATSSMSNGDVQAASSDAG